MRDNNEEFTRFTPVQQTTMSQHLSCPSCGAPLEVRNRFIRVITCDFCANVAILTDTGLDPTGMTANLSQVKSMFFVDAIGKLHDRRFRCVGRVRFQYDDGLWDEWLLEFDNGDPGWLVEDDGNFKFYVRHDTPDALPTFDELTVGESRTIGAHTVFVSEKGDAQIAGSEGQIAFPVVPGQIIQYVDGSAGDVVVSIEYAGNDVEYLTGKCIAHADITVEKDDYF